MITKSDRESSCAQNDLHGILDHYETQESEATGSQRPSEGGMKGCQDRGRNWKRHYQRKPNRRIGV